MYIRKTTDEWHIESNHGYGWDLETIELSYKEAKEQLKCYRDNINVPVRLIKRRVKI